MYKILPFFVFLKTNNDGFAQFLRNLHLQLIFCKQIQLHLQDKPEYYQKNALISG